MEGPKRHPKDRRAHGGCKGHQEDRRGNTGGSERAARLQGPNKWFKNTCITRWPLGLLGSSGHMSDPFGFVARSDPPVVPSGPLGVSPDPPVVPSGPRDVSWIPRVPSGPFGRVFSGAPVPWILQWHGNSLVRPAAAAPSPGVLLPAVRWLSSLAAAHVCVCTCTAVATGLVLVC
jgi:hypothetical protein